MKNGNWNDSSSMETATAMQENLTNVINETKAMAYEACGTVRRVKEHLFGQVPEHCTGEAKNAGPTCFRDELLDVRREFMRMCSELREICSELGI